MTSNPNDQTFGNTSRVRGCHHAITKCLMADPVESTQCDLGQDLRPNHFRTPIHEPVLVGKREKRWATKSFLDLPFSPHLQEPNDLMRSPPPLMNANLYGKEQAHPFH